MKNTSEHKRDTFSIRIEEDIKELLREIAIRENRSLNNLIETILKEYLERKTKV